MPTFVAKPSIWRQLLLLAGALGFVVAGAWIAGLLGSDYPQGREWLGWVCMIFFGACLVGIGLRLFESDDVLRIGPSGIWYRHWSTDTIPWHQITKVGVWEHRGQRTVLLHLVDPSRFPSTTLAGKLAAANRALTGGDIAINIIGTDRSVDELLDAIGDYQQ